VGGTTQLEAAEIETMADKKKTHTFYHLLCYHYIWSNTAHYHQSEIETEMPDCMYTLRSRCIVWIRTGCWTSQWIDRDV